MVGGIAYNVIRLGVRRPALIAARAQRRPTQKSVVALALR